MDIENVKKDFVEIEAEKMEQVEPQTTGVEGPITKKVSVGRKPETKNISFP